MPRAAPDVPPEQVHVGKFSRYRDVKRAVDSLSVARVPDKRMTVLARGLRWSPPLTGPRAARLGAWLGAATGAASLLLLTLLGVATFWWATALLAGGFFGALVGTVMGLVIWRVSRDRAVLPESGHVEVDRYDLLVDREDLPKARRLLGD